MPYIIDSSNIPKFLDNPIPGRSINNVDDLKHNPLNNNIDNINKSVISVNNPICNIRYNKENINIE